jgi:RNA binding exosome subunit
MAQYEKGSYVLKVVNCKTGDKLITLYETCSEKWVEVSKFYLKKDKQYASQITEKISE